MGRFMQWAIPLGVVLTVAWLGLRSFILASGYEVTPLTLLLFIVVLLSALGTIYNGWMYRRWKRER